MIIVTQYVPGFVDTGESRERAEVETVFDIHKIPWLQRHRPLDLDGNYVVNAKTRYVVALLHSPDNPDTPREEVESKQPERPQMEGPELL